MRILTEELHSGNERIHARLYARGALTWYIAILGIIETNPRHLKDRRFACYRSSMFRKSPE
jgi:hypothetical protein